MRQTSPNLLRPYFLALKYLNFFPCDFTGGYVGTFLQDKLGFRVGLPDKIFENPFVHSDPRAFNFFWQHPCFDKKEKECGNLVCSITSGEKDNLQGLLLEIQMQTSQTVPQAALFSREAVLNWVEHSHSIVHDSFFAIVDKIKETLD